MIVIVNVATEFVKNFEKMFIHYPEEGVKPKH